MGSITGTSGHGAIQVSGKRSDHSRDQAQTSSWTSVARLVGLSPLGIQRTKSGRVDEWTSGGWRCCERCRDSSSAQCPSKALRKRRGGLCMKTHRHAAWSWAVVLSGVLWSSLGKSNAVQTCSSADHVARKPLARVTKQELHGRFCGDGGRRGVHAAGHRPAQAPLRKTPKMRENEKCRRPRFAWQCKSLCGVHMQTTVRSDPCCGQYSPQAQEPSCDMQQ